MLLLFWPVLSIQHVIPISIKICSLCERLVRLRQGPQLLLVSSILGNRSVRYPISYIHIVVHQGHSQRHC